MTTPEQTVSRRQIFWEDVEEGQELPGFSLYIDATRMVKQVSGSQDFYPVHHDSEFARASGHPDIFVNTGFLQGCFMRLLGGFLGSRGQLRKFKMEMRRTNLLGETVAIGGRVVRMFAERDVRYVELELSATTEREGITTVAHALAALPTTSSSVC